MKSVGSLTQDGRGYVYWNEVEVEHYDGSIYADMKEQADDLITRCLHLDSIVVPVNVNTAIWCWDWFKIMYMVYPYKALLVQIPEFWQRDSDNDFLVTFGRSGSDNTGWWHEAELYRKNNDWIKEVWERWYSYDIFQYHRLESEGYRLADMGQGQELGTCYAQLADITAVLRREEVPFSLSY